MVKKASFMILALILTVALFVPTIVQAKNVSACAGEGEEGLTPGYWKNHTDCGDWPTYSPGQYFDDVFGTGPHITLLEALNSKGGGLNALYRHAVAGLLNAAHPDISYCYGTPAQLISVVAAAIDSGDEDVIEALKDDLDECNNYGVPWDD